jgi:hypothetical protein
MAVHVLGIRHHGVGSAKRVLQFLQAHKPDLVLVEGPPEISKLLADIGNPELVPPVAMMVYDTQNPASSVFYPFAEYSPEWVAAKYANENSIPVQAIDLPATQSFTLKEELNEALPQRDPMDYLAEISGFDDGEQWWEHHFEQGEVASASEHFDAVMLTMQTLRQEGISTSLDPINVYREAYMRNAIIGYQNQFYSNIVVVCGAWHAPTLLQLNDAKANAEDVKILKKLSKAKISLEASWIPWTNSRLSVFSGYGAGLNSPGWYEHLWTTPHHKEENWLVKIAQAFRNQGIDVSTAHIMETFRLAESLAALRGNAHIALADLTEAVFAVMCMGDAIVYEVVRQKIVVGHKIGSLPDNLARVPLQQDFETEVKSLRLQLTDYPKTYDLDLRKPLDLKRSVFFHRLEILGITWAQKTQSANKGTFKESWQLAWNPEMQIVLIDKAHFGNSIEIAAAALVCHKTEQTKLIADYINLIQGCLPAELFESITFVLHKLQLESAITTDTVDLMVAWPNLVSIVKYGNVRKTDTEELKVIVEKLFTKILVSLQNTVYGLDEDNSVLMFELIKKLDNAVIIYENTDFKQQWHVCLKNITDKKGAHHIVLGCTMRLLFDNQCFTEEESNTFFSFFLSTQNDPALVAFWVEGFLTGSGLILLYDNRIWNLIYQWLDGIEATQFVNLLPVLRRAFSKFPFAERRQIGEKAKDGLVHQHKILQNKSPQVFDQQLAESILPTITKMLALNP